MRCPFSSCQLHTAEEPREAPKRSVDMFLDLAATEEDHQQVRPQPKGSWIQTADCPGEADWKWERLHDAGGKAEADAAFDSAVQRSLESLSGIGVSRPRQPFCYHIYLLSTGSSCAAKKMPQRIRWAMV